MNIEGPILYYRTDILKRCGVEKPATIKDVEAAAEKIKACDSTITPFVSRGLKPAIAYTFSNMLHNIGGSYMANGKSQSLLGEGQGGAGDLQPAAARLWPARRRQLQLPADIGALSQRPRRDVVRILQRTAHRDGRRRAAQGHRPGAVPGGRGRAGADRDRLGHGGVGLQQAAGVRPGTSCNGRPARRSRSAWRCRGSRRRGRRSPTIPNTASGSMPSRCARNGRPRSTCSPPRDPPRSAIPIVANPESREFIGQAVQDLILKQKTVDQACADADKALDALIAQK